MDNAFNTDCLAQYDINDVEKCYYKESRKFVTITIKTKQEREDVYFQLGEYVAAQNCQSERVLSQNISSIPYMLVNGGSNAS